MAGWLKKTFFWLALFPMAWAGGLFWFVGLISAPPLPHDEKTDAIVILTGGSNRIDYGLSLLAQDKGKILFVSGAGKAASIADMLKFANPNTRQALAATGRESLVVLGNNAENTIGNAEETLRFLGGKNVKTLRLVTSNYHMPRALNEFSALMPEVAIIPCPVAPDDFSLEEWWRDENARRLILSEYHKYLASKLRHWFVSATHRS